MTTDPLALVLWAYLASAAVMALLWWVQRIVRNASIADMGWCMTLFGVVLWYAVHVSGTPERRLLLALLAAGYGLRLGLAILFTRVLGQPEDPRYARLRQQWGADGDRNLFLYFQLQAAAVPLFSLPFLVVMQNPRPTFSLWEYAGVGLWLAGVIGETVADAQLADFKRQPWNRSHVCRKGLWYYSRHTNYFFEWVHWWSYVVMAVGLPNGWLTWVGPAAMGWALLKVTGVPHAEAQALRSRGNEYRHYQLTTNAFIPWFPRRNG